MGFKLKSGNKTSFKDMGGTEQSPAKDMKTGKYEHSFESPVNNKKVMFNDKPVKDKGTKKSQEDWQPAYPGADYSKQEIKRMSEVEKQQNIDGYEPKKKESPAKQYENPSDRKRETPGQYWYKINNKPASKAEYVKYQNKPGGDEPGKQTNNPDVSGNKAKTAKNRAKLNKEIHPDNVTRAQKRQARDNYEPKNQNADEVD